MVCLLEGNIQRQIQALQITMGLCFIHAHQVFDLHRFRSGSQAHRNIDGAALFHHFSRLGQLIDDFTNAIFIAICLQLLHNFQIIVIGNVLKVNALQIRHFHQLSLGRCFSAADQDRQEDHHRHHHRNGTGDHRCRRNTATADLLIHIIPGPGLAFFLPGRFFGSRFRHRLDHLGLIIYALRSCRTGFSAIAGLRRLQRNGLCRLIHFFYREHHGRILSEFIHICQHSSSGSIAISQIMGHSLHNDLLQALGHIGIDHRGLHRTAGDMLDGHRHRRFAIKRRTAGDHFIHNNAQGVQIRPAIHLAALGLLRGNIVHRAQSFLGQSVTVGHDTGDAKVRHPDGAVFQQHHIMGLDIPMDQSTAVSVLQTLGDLGSEVKGLLPVEDTFHFHILLQRNAIDQLHNDVIRIAGGGNIVDRYDVGMAQHANRLTLRMETAAEVFILQVFIFQNLDGHQSV